MMTEPLQEIIAVRWLELRDDRGRLMAKLEPRRLLLEVRHDGRGATFDLWDYLVLTRDHLSEVER